MNSDNNSPKPKGKSSFIPGQKVEKKNPLADAAKKYFAKKSPAIKKRKPKSEDGTIEERKRKPLSGVPAKKFFSPKITKEEEEDTIELPKVSDEIRLNKYLSHAGVASRRRADELIKEGKVKVNGTVVVEMGYKVKAKDLIEFEGKKLSLEKKYYVLLNKPKDFITTLKDEKDRRTVMELLRGVYAQIKSPTAPRLYPVGRLDRNTTGVLLITNDGELAQKLTHPSSEIKKVYHVVLDKKLMKEDFDKIAEGGVVLEDGIAEVDEIAYPNAKNRAEVGIQIHTGKNRFIRRLFESLGYEVEKLDRVFFAGLTKKDVPRGRWRFLTEEEVRLLKHFLN
jgi:23S rRNA pseudouridine2605 synthase